MHDIRYCLKAKLLETNLRMRNNLAKLLPHRFCKESVAVTLSTTCHGSRAIESPDVRVATIVVRVIKRKFATRRFSNSFSAIPSLLAMLHRMIFAVLSRSSEYKSSVIFVLVEDV